MRLKAVGQVPDPAKTGRLSGIGRPLGRIAPMGCRDPDPMPGSWTKLLSCCLAPCDKSPVKSYFLEQQGEV